MAFETKKFLILSDIIVEPYFDLLILYYQTLSLIMRKCDCYINYHTNNILERIMKFYYYLIYHLLFALSPIEM